MSANVCHITLDIPQRVQAHGVTRSGKIGIPDIIKQEQFNNRETDLEKFQHTVKSYVMRNDSICRGIVCLSLYYTKPVYFFYNTCCEIKWMLKERYIFSKTQHHMVKINFSILNLLDYYNNNRGNVDVADQLYHYYIYDKQWNRNHKWWWSIWWCGVQSMLTNS